LLYPNVNIYEKVGQLSKVELALKELCTDEELKKELLEILHINRQLEVELYETAKSNAKLDLCATIMAQTGLEDILLPECLDFPNMRQGLVRALQAGGLSKCHEGLKLKNWKERQLGYFIMQLCPFEKGTMPNNELSAFFHVSNLSKAISSYMDTSRQKPNGYKAVDDVIRAIA